MKRRKRNKTFIEKFLEHIIPTLILILISCLIIQIASLYISANVFENSRLKVLMNYFLNGKFFYNNFIYIFLLVSILYLIFGKVSLAFFVGGSFLIILSILNNFRIYTYANNIKLGDLLFLREIVDKVFSYYGYFTLNLPAIIALFIALILSAFLIHNKDKTKIKYRKTRILAFLILVSYLALKINNNQDIIKEVKEDKGFNEIYKQGCKLNTDVLAYQYGGFINSFFNSKSKLNIENKEDLDKKLNNYSYINMKDKEKINIVFLGLESFVDFSDRKDFQTLKNEYKVLKRLKSKSIHGKLISKEHNVDTFQNYLDLLTNCSTSPHKIKGKYTYIDYFKDQGYEARSLFFYDDYYYRKRKIDENIGFKFQSYPKGYLYRDLVNRLIELDEELKEKAYIVSASNYQNRIFYSKDSYLKYIDEVNLMIGNLVRYYEDKEPTILIIYGENTPTIGRSNRDIGSISTDIREKEGFLNLYETPYIIWANDLAKERFNKNFKKQGETISPNYLIPYLLEYLEIYGDEYIQYMNELREYYPVNDKYYYFKEDNLYIKRSMPKYLKEKESDYNYMRNK